MEISPNFSFKKVTQEVSLTIFSKEFPPLINLRPSPNLTIIPEACLNFRKAKLTKEN